jgi:dihydrofolate reductase
VIVGSKTFQQYKGVIYPFPDATTFVCTSRCAAADEPINPRVQYVSGAVEEIARQIQAAGFSNAVLSGGAETNGRFAEALAIDEMIVSIYPHVLGSGLPIFGGRQVQLRLELLGTKQLGSGVIQSRYTVVR